MTYWLRGTTTQTDFAREAFELWDDLIAIDLDEVTPFAGRRHRVRLCLGHRRYAFASFDRNNPNIGHVEIQRNGNETSLTRISTSAPTRLLRCCMSSGTRFGLSHPGSYNAREGDNQYAAHAECTQDTRQYTVMSVSTPARTAATPATGDPMPPRRCCTILRRSRPSTAPT